MQIKKIATPTIFTLPGNYVEIGGQTYIALRLNSESYKVHTCAYRLTATELAMTT